MQGAKAVRLLEVWLFNTLMNVRRYRVSKYTWDRIGQVQLLFSNKFFNRFGKQTINKNPRQVSAAAKSNMCTGLLFCEDADPRQGWPSSCIFISSEATPDLSHVMYLLCFAIYLVMCLFIYLFVGGLLYILLVSLFSPQLNGVDYPPLTKKKKKKNKNPRERRRLWIILLIQYVLTTKTATPQFKP